MRSYRLQVGIFSLAALVFLILIVSKSQTLFFVWEEWGQLWDAVEKPFWGIFQSHFGYMAPLSRFIFALEAKTFGTWYAGYALVNAGVLVAFVYFFWREFRSNSITTQVIVLAGSITFMFSAGVIFAVNFAAMLGYFMCWLFGILALRLWRRSGSWVAPSGLLIAGALSNNLMNITVTAFVVAVILADGRGRKLSLRPALILGLVGLLTSAFLLFIARFLPAADSAVASSQSLAGGGLTDIPDRLIQMFSLIATWLAAPFLGPLVLDQSLYSRLVILFMDYQLILIGAFLVLFVIFLVTVGKKGSWTFLFMLISLASFALQVSLFRGVQGFEVRYTLMWLPSAIALWVLWSTPRSAVRNRWLVVVGSVAMSVTAVVVLIGSFWYADQSIDLIRPRTLLSEELRQGVEKCGTNEQLTTPSELTPGMTWDEVCDAAGFLRQS